VSSERLRFALEQLQPTQWKRFEEFASAFFAVEYPGLRTVAGSGDRGRDGEVISPPEDPTVLFQYSVADDWASKIRSTGKQVSEEFPDAAHLIYATNQAIGPKADTVKADVRRDYSLFVEVRDCSWFVERYALDAARATAAEALVQDIAVPILADRGLVERKAPALSSGEARAACVYLSLQWGDDVREKGLTKLCFEALVRSVLRGTNPRNRMSRAEVHEHVASLLSATDRERLDLLTDGALSRLERRALRHWRTEDEFCLTQEEHQRIQQSLAEVELAESELLEAIAWETAKTYEAFNLTPPANIRALAECVRVAIEAVLYKQGETFAAAVTTGAALTASRPDLEAAVTYAMSEQRLPANLGGGRTAEILQATSRVVLTEPAEPVQQFFRSFADAYTLFAFLRETPDVQSAVVKMFSVGQIWLDTTVVLPLFAESLIEDPSRRRFTNIFRAAVECGLSLRMTHGVLEELDTHTRNSITYARQPNNWHGRPPFLASMFLLSGHPLSAFGQWTRRFRGERRPMEDLAEYLDEEHGIELGSLNSAADTASTRLRGAVQEIWHETHDRRRQLKPDIQLRLVSHDVENYLGVVQRRRGEKVTAFGYETWWLTLDGTAFEVPRILREQLGEDAPDSPVMSPDFMVSFLAIGPLRAQLNRSAESRLPLSVADLGDGLPQDLLDQAQSARQLLEGEDDRVIRREVRDKYDLYRRRMGAQAKGGLALVEQELEAELTAAQR
jgi:hypothetical protein